MRILHLTRDYPPASCGGISTAVGDLVRALDGNGVANAVISFDRWRGGERRDARFERPDSGEVILRVHSGNPSTEIERRAASFSPSLIHLHHENLWHCAEALRRDLPCPIVYTTHVLQLDRGKSGTTSASDQRRALQDCDLVVAPSRAAAREIVATNETGRPMAVVPNVVASAPQRPRVLSRQRRALYVGRFDHAKGTDTLFDAMHAILSRDPHIEFDIAGGCPASPKGERRWLRRCDHRLESRLRQRAHFHGWLDNRALQTLRANASVQLVPSRAETFGLSAAEAMAGALPVVAARAPALTELVTDRETGLLADVEDFRGMADGAHELLERPQLAREIGFNAARSIEERYSASVIAARMLEAYATAS